MAKYDLRQDASESWYWYLTGQSKDGFSVEYERLVRRYRRISRLFPGKPRCFECSRPLSGLGSWLSGTRPSTFHPLLCNYCEQVIRTVEAGAEVELSLLFADVRGSTRLAEQVTALEFKDYIQRFYKAASGVLVEHNAMVNRLMGDQVIGLFVPRFAGSNHAQVAVDAAVKMLRATGNGDQAGMRIPIGIGVHTGLAYVGAVGSNSGVNEIAVLGNAANFAARLSAQAADGEILVSETTAALAHLPTEKMETRTLELKGISQPAVVHVLRLDRSERIAN